MGQPNSTSTKAQFPSTPNAQSDKAQWEWKSNANPFSQTEEAQWTPYNPMDNYLLEKAHYENQKEVDLGLYLISIKDMLQRKKDNPALQRPIRRNTEISNHPAKISNQEENLRAKRFFGAETPKTFNEAFGNLSDYLKFFQNRGPDIKEFAIMFNEIENANNLNLLNKIVQPCLINCLQNESKKIPARTDYQRQAENQLLILFQGTVQSITEFYANVLKAYTMESFLYRNINNYLRNENWTQLDPLLPYAYCLCKAFLRQEFTSPNSEPAETPSMTVYRGAQFDQITLSFYDPDTVKNFCWNGVTSTSRNRKVSESFMFYNFDPKKAPVLFIIEIPLSSKNTWIDIKPYSAIPNEDEVVLPPGSVFELIKVSKGTNHAVEINLKLISNVDKLAHMGQIMHGAMNSEMSNDTSLKLVCLEGRELTDALVHLKGNRLIEELEFCLCKFDDKVVSFDKLPRLKSLTFISSFSGNEVHWNAILKDLQKSKIQKLQISDNIFNNKLLSILSQGIRSLASLQSLNLTFRRCNDISDEGLTQLSSQGLTYLTSLSSLSLNFAWCSITDEGLKNLSSHGLKKLTSLTSLTLDFEMCFTITDAGLSDLSSQGLKYLTSIKYLDLNFESCEVITDEGLKNLALKHLTSLTSLVLNFQNCYNITNEGLNHLGLRFLTSLQSLNLDFGWCREISDEGLKNLAFGNLTSLALDFTHCHKITDQGFKNLALKDLTSLSSLALRGFSNITDEGLKNLTIEHLVCLTSLALDFVHCKQITDQGLKSITLKNLTSLKSLTLLFNSCDEITNEGLDQLCPNTSLTSLALHFTSCSKITDEGLKNLALKDLTSLTSLTLDFARCNEITDEGLKILTSQEFPLVTSLILSFAFCEKITDEGKKELQKFLRFKNSASTKNHQNVKCTSFERKQKPGDSDKFTNKDMVHPNIIIKGDQIPTLKAMQTVSCLTLDFKCDSNITDETLKNLILTNFPSIISLTLDLTECEQITDEGLKNLCSEKGLQCLTSLTSLALNFEGCKITDKGMGYLCSQGLKHLTLLTSLALNFNACEITNEGLDQLSFQGLKNLTSLTSLNLSFIFCMDITDEGLKNFTSHGLKSLASLMSLDLSFNECEITDEGLSYLSSQGLRKMVLLTSLNLNFFDCKKITGQGLNNLASRGLKSLALLTSLALDFRGCNRIHIDAWNNLCKVLKYLGYEILIKDTVLSNI